MLKNNRRGVILVISSPSGAGKTTICKNIIEKVDNVSLSISVTTRKKRKGEIEGKDYFFKTNEEFIPMMSKNEFIESAKVFGNFYGTLKAEVLQKIEDGIDVLVDIDWQGTRQIQKYMPEDIVKIFVNELRKVLAINNLEALLEECVEDKFHIHSHTLPTILTSNKDEIFYVCNHC